jgi:hypothetical protein
MVVELPPGQRATRTRFMRAMWPAIIVAAIVFIIIGGALVASGH